MVRNLSLNLTMGVRFLLSNILLENIESMIPLDRGTKAHTNYHSTPRVRSPTLNSRTFGVQRCHKECAVLIEEM